MIGLPGSVRIYLATGAVDLRNGPDGLAAVVRKAFDDSVFSGHLFVFLSRRSDRVKILWWDRGGYVVYYKRLEKGRFRRPANPSAATRVTLSAAELSSLLEGIDLTRAKRSKLWEPACRKGIDSPSPM